MAAHRMRSRSGSRDEEDSLLSGPVRRDRRQRWRELSLLAWAVAATVIVVILSVLNCQGHGHGADGRKREFSGKRNLVFMVSDGMGPTSVALSRSWRQYRDGLAVDDVLELDKLLIGQSRTRSNSSLVTDSAAGATAFSCGEKSYNGAISVLPDGRPCGSVMEAAKRVGYATGLVVTTWITDATPAVFASHVRTREMQPEIALQMVGATHPLGRVVDLILGGGRCFFEPNGTSGSCRPDDTDVIAAARKLGWTYADRFEAVSSKLPSIGLFEDGEFPYEIDRPDDKPSLAQMTKRALEILAKATEKSDHGFFIMIEGSRIDHAGHANDPAAQVREVEAYDQAMSAVVDFAKKSKTPTLMVATSDHETGGLAAGRQLTAAYPEYHWLPEALNKAKQSAYKTANQIRGHEDDLEYVRKVVSNRLGITDANSTELQTVAKGGQIALADLISRRAQTGWTTHGHTGADVNIYSSDLELAADLAGNHENTDVGRFLRKFLGVDREVEKVTAELREKMKKYL
ncbi:alkaline phosphatase-like protein [Piedraia hortae CBS 480.64]|uniref:Alkaline phosphatase n=1 Tax=Piedraia hortae CBS 480.64 TaxID=1314780 RepID=A0A6A7BV58_9PEZI|nr:alkaline phosphatase-like protein [Piedraia hortae CBS 480.64]